LLVPTGLRIALFGVTGLVFGSFLTVVVHRVPRKEALVGGRSRCPSCGATIAARDNIPVVSFALLRGHCRHCGAAISARYPLIELATASLFIAAAVVFEDIFVAAIMAPFLGVLLAVALIDAEHRVVPNAVVYPSLTLFAAAVLLGAVFGRGLSLSGAGLGLLLFGGGTLVVALARPGGIGMGDVKLAALMGLVLGSLGLRFVAVAAGLGILLGGVGGLAALAAGHSRKSTIPFGPYLAAGAIAAAFVGGAIARWYLSLLG
jgi:leader peptidase (prepilin peptidase) / N-methyltransferase